MTITAQIELTPATAPSGRGAPLRIGVVLDSSLRVPAWVAKLLAELGKSDDFAIATIVLAEAPPTRGRGAAAFRAFSTLLFRAYTWADRRIFQRADDAWLAVDMTAWARGVPQVRLVAGHERPQGLAADVLRELSAADLDVVLDFSSRDIPDDVAAAARCGVWSCHDGGPGRNAKMPPLVAAMYENHPVAETVLRCRGGADAPARVLYRGVFSVNPSSLCATRNTSAWNAAAYVLCRLGELQRQGWTHLCSPETFAANDRHVEKTVHPPGNWTTLCLVARLLWRWLGRRMWQLRFEERWCIAIRSAKGGASTHNVEEVRFLTAEPDRSYADPFLFRRGGRTFLFVEHISHPSWKGAIACLELDAEGNWHGPQTVLSADYHFSYPFVFAWEDDVYLLPESSAHRTLELYRAVEFPGKWTLDRVIMDDVVAVDATIAPFDGRYWLFVNLLSPGKQIDQELHLFHSATPLGPWTPHARNPVCADVRRARPAGRLFTCNGKLIRPSQDCSVRYGYGLVWNLVETLTPTDYREREIGRLEPNWLPGSRGVHTFVRDGDLEMVDVRYPVRRACCGVRRRQRPPALPQTNHCQWLPASLVEAVGT